MLYRHCYISFLQAQVVPNNLNQLYAEHMKRTTIPHWIDNFRSPIRMHNPSTTTYDYECNTEIYGLIRIATDDAGSYPWLILCQNRESVTWALLDMCAWVDRGWICQLICRERF